MTDPASLRRQLAAAVPVDDPAWRTALETVPRELFLSKDCSNSTAASGTPCTASRPIPKSG